MSAQTPNSAALWCADFAQSSPLFAGLMALAQPFITQRWPSLDEYNQIALAYYQQYCIPKCYWRTFVSLDHSTLSFEQQVHTQAQVPTRLENWHDYFNFWSWLYFPQAKAQLFQRYTQVPGYLTQSQARVTRTPLQNRLALLEEGGVVIGSDNPALLAQIQGMQWQTLFWTHRAWLKDQLLIKIFGHAIWEKLLNPYLGLTANAVLFLIPSEWLHWSAIAQAKAFDQLLADWLSGSEVLHYKTELCPFPLLGMPGAYPGNNCFAFYQQTDYFRSQRKT